MKCKFKLSMLSLCLMALTTPALGAEAKNQDVEKLITKISARTSELENEIKLLKAQIKYLKVQKPKTLKKSSVKSFRLPKPESTFRTCQLGNRHASISGYSLKSYINYKNLSQQSQDVSETDQQEEDLGAYLLHGTAVVTSPYLGERSAFDGSNLIVLNGGINQDVGLLQQEKKLSDVYKKFGQPFPDNPVLELSGRVENQAVYLKNYSGSQSDINLSNVELDLVPVVNAWTTGLVSYLFNDSMTAPVRERNSRIFLNNAFATVGNFNVSPFYLSAGQMYVPFAGQYSSFMLSSPLPQQLGQVRARSLLLGYQPLSGNGLYGAIFAFKGDSNTSDYTQSNINNMGLNLGFKYKKCDWAADVGGSYIPNIGDALGLQLNTANNSAGFIGFGNTFASERLEHRVPGIDGHVNWSLGNYRLFFEYVGATKAFSRNNLYFNDEGASPKSANIEGAYKFNICRFPSSFAIGYTRTWEAFALNLPEQRYNATFNLSFLKDTITSLEYRHDINYPNGTTGGGNGPDGTPVAFTPGDVLGKTADQITLQFGIYW